MGFELEVKSVAGDVITLEGWPVLFDSIDVSGEYFSADTDFVDELRPEKLPVLYEHGSDPNVGPKVLGHVAELRKSPVGLWAKMVIDNAGELADDIIRWVQQGKLGLSSGTIGYLMRRAGSKISRWPLVEVSLTRSPAEPATMSLAFAMKSGLWDVDYTLRAMKRAQLVDQLWEFVGKAKDPDERRAWELRADLLELEGDIERMQHERKLERKSRLIKRLRELEG